MSSMTMQEPTGADDVQFTPWDRRMIAAIEVANGARRGVLILRVSAVLIAVAAVVGNALATFSEIEQNGIVFEQDVDPSTVGRFLAGIANPLAFAGIVFALSYVVQIAAARLDIDIVLADEDETSSEEGD